MPGRFRLRSTRHDSHGQATVELAVVLVVIVMIVLAVVQVAVVVRDRLALITAVRVGSRAAAVEPDEHAVRSSIEDQMGNGSAYEVRLTGSLSSGSIATLRVSRRVTRVPLVGVMLSSSEMSEQISFRIEGPP